MIAAIRNYLGRPHGWFFLLARLGFFDKMPDEKYLRLVYRYTLGTEPDFEHPKTINEKLNWLKLHDHNPLYSRLVDKYEVRSYVAEKVGIEYLIPLVGGPWDSVEDIDFNSLPDQFVLKCTHDSGSYVICTDKAKLDRKAAKSRLAKRLKRNYYLTNREWPYLGVKPRVLAEAFLKDDLTVELLDYKFFCFDGVPRVLYVSNDQNKHPRTDFYDMDFKRLPFKMKDEPSENGYLKPVCFEEMKQLAKRLSEGIPHVRMDFYCVNGRPYFGEFTMYHNSGFQSITPPEWNDIMGSWIHLPCDEEQP